MKILDLPTRIYLPAELKSIDKSPDNLKTSARIPLWKRVREWIVQIKYKVVNLSIRYVVSSWS